MSAIGKALVRPISYAVGRVADGVSNIVGKIAEKGFGAIATITDSLVKQGYKQETATTIENNKDRSIKGIQIHRHPISSALTAVANTLTGGQWKESIKNLKYDSLFHLSMILILDNNTKLICEKLYSIHIAPTQKPSKGLFVSVPNINLETALNKTKALMGERFFTYDAYRNNCQDFVSSFLTANNLLNPTLQAYIRQDTVSLLKEQPGFANALTKTLSNTGAILL